MSARPLRVLVASVVAMLAVACSSGGVAVENPVPTIFPDDAAVAPADTGEPTSSTTTIPVADRLPPLADSVAGAVRTPEGALLAIEGTDGATWTVVGPCAGTSVVDTVSEQIGPQLVVLDPGHGGPDTGAEGPDGLTEAALNLDVARRTAALLEADGVAVTLTRTADTALSSRARVAAAGAVGARAFVSIHHNDAGDRSTDGPGTEAFYEVDDPESRRLAGLVYGEVADALAAFDVAWWAPAQPGVKYLLNQRGDDYFTVLRDSDATPAVLVEVAVLANPAEAALLASEEGRAAEARALATALVRFLVDDDEGRGFVEPVERVREAGPTASTECP